MYVFDRHLLLRSTKTQCVRYFLADVMKLDKEYRELKDKYCYLLAEKAQLVVELERLRGGSE